MGTNGDNNQEEDIIELNTSVIQECEKKSSNEYRKIHSAFKALYDYDKNEKDEGMKLNMGEHIDYDSHGNNVDYSNNNTRLDTTKFRWCGLESIMNLFN